MTADYTDIQVQRPADGLVIATLVRPERRNALSDEMFNDFLRLQRELAADPSVRALILTGSGRGFCAGLDLDLAAELPAMGFGGFLANQERWAAAITGFSRLGVPVIAAVNGAAAGAGFGLALAADIRVAGESARFNAAFVRIGLSAGDVGTSWFLPRIVGTGRAAEILLTGRFVDATEALSIGLVSRVVADAEVLDTAIAIADQIRRNSPFSMRMSKQVITTNLGAGSLDVALAVENRNQALATQTLDFAEALTAFREHRDPVFTGG